MSATAQFCWGFAGSLAYEVIILFQVYHTEPIRFPERYSKLGFYVVRLLVAIMAGGLAVAYEIQKPILALNVGASAPLLIFALGQGLKGQSPSGTGSG